MLAALPKGQLARQSGFGHHAGLFRWQVIF